VKLKSARWPFCWVAFLNACYDRVNTSFPKLYTFVKDEKGQVTHLLLLWKDGKFGEQRKSSKLRPHRAFGL
jgi:hypothetical protein